MKRVAAFAALALTSVALTSCGDDDYEPPVTTTRVDSYCDPNTIGIRVYVTPGRDGEMMAVIADPSCL